MDFLVEQFLTGVILSMPSLGAFAVGMVLSLVFWRRAPIAAFWGLLSFAWMFLMYLVQIGWHTVAPDFVDPESFEEYLGRFLLSVLEVPGYMGFLLAIFRGRTAMQRYRSFHDDGPPTEPAVEPQPNPPRS